MKDTLLYVLGELLMTEVDQIADVHYIRDEKNCLYITLKDGNKYKVTLEAI